MILSWFFYVIIVGAAASAGAAALARLLRALQLPTRGVWLGAMIVSLGAPLGALVRHGAVIPVTDPTASTALLGPALTTTWIITAGATDVPWLAASLLLVWAATSLVLLVRLGGGLLRLRQAVAEWPEHDVDGVRVRVSNQLGPAVAGIRTAHIVVPQWLLAIDAPSRALVLRHEDEHRVARDPLALASASLACALAPWNIALWWQASRLRLAVEMDCDARVLRRASDVHRYGLLLLDIAQRGAVGALTPAPALSEPASFLERRIHAMTSTPSRHPARLAMLGALTIAAVAFACSAPSPTNATNGPTPRAEPPVTGRAPSTGEKFFEFRIEKPATIKPGQPAPRFPDEMRQQGIEGEVIAQFVVDTTGSIIPSTIKFVKATNDVFRATVRNALPALQFTPAEVGGRKVKQMLTMPFNFSLSK